MSLLFSIFRLVMITCYIFPALADIPHLTHRDLEAYNALAFGLVPNQTYHTVNFSSPLFLINTFHPDGVSKDSHIFLSPAMEGQDQSPLIFDSRDFSLVYADPSWGGGSDARLQTFNDSQYLTFWSGKHHKGWGDGGDVIVDNTYRKRYNLTTVNVSNGADGHEFQLTDDGAALINNFHSVHHNLSSVGGPTNGTLQTNVFQKIDIATGEELFSWSALDHFSFTESFVSYDSNADREEGWDWFHLNSIQQIPASVLFPTEDGSESPPYYLISSRHLCAVMLISGTTGDKVWQLGGKKNDFASYYTDQPSQYPRTGNTAPPSPAFTFQHDVRLHFPSSSSSSQGGRKNELRTNTAVHLTLFDNHNMIADDSWDATPGCMTNCSRGLRLGLDLETLAITSTTELAHPAGVRAYAEGGYQELPSSSSPDNKSNALVAFGKVPALVEFSGDDKGVAVVMDVQTGPWADGASSLYRAFKGSWEVDLMGLGWGPEVAVERMGAAGGEGGEVFVSWNGATGVEGWRLHGGESAENMEEMQDVRRDGFETTISVEGNIPRMVRVDALDGEGNVLRSSEVVDTGAH